MKSSIPSCIKFNNLVFDHGAYSNKILYNDKFVSNLDIILRKADVINALDLVNKNAKIFRLIRESQDMDEESKKVLNGYGVLFALCAAKESGKNPSEIIDLLNKD